ncbi:PLP-dependent transferase [Lentithecium fluviatile CBS 122367]|uniref:PLP-dependent transferase n=1 Tax=Lentithecium fluviatile CBS 122367 TaxID=1168545 RepID=A0A6G1J0B6_9PLEO|nr:PLP-dependent transferase [Lentithecium fluviatile CBS 122367]
MTSGEKALEVRTKTGGRFGKELLKEFLLDKAYRNLNHGSFGTYPRAIREKLQSFQEQVEARPDQFIRYTYPQLLDESRAAIANVLNAPTEEIVFVPNATTGVNTVLRSFVFNKGDYILYFATIYGACEKTINYITETTPASSIKIAYTYPVEDDWLVAEFKMKVTGVIEAGGRVKAAVFDTVVSMPGVRMPFERLVAACKELGVLSIVDGAHGVGHVELDLGKLGADFFVSNCHKWLHVPRGCAVFYVPLRNQPLIRSTLPTSHGFVPVAGSISNPLPASAIPKSSFVVNFEFVGTIDNAPYLCIPAAIQWRESIGGEAAIRDYCWTLAQEGTRKVAKVLGTEVLENSAGTLTRCCMANVRLPLVATKLQEMGAQAGIEKGSVGMVVRDWISRVLVDDYDTFMAAMWYGGAWWIRLSAQVYLDLDDFEWAAQVLTKVSNRAAQGEWVGLGSKL